MEIKNTMTGRLFIVIITFRARFFHRISSIFTGCLTKSMSMSIYIYIYVMCRKLLRKCTHAFIFHRELT